MILDFRFSARPRLRGRSRQGDCPHRFQRLHHATPLRSECLEERSLLTATLAPDPVSFLGPVIEGTYRGAVDTFTDNRANAGVADLTANISWGDGSPNTAGTIIALGGGKFEVDGTHVFQAGTYNPTVSISDTAANLHETAVLPSSSVLHVLDGSLVAGPVTVAPISGVPFDGPLH